MSTKAKSKPATKSAPAKAAKKSASAGKPVMALSKSDSGKKGPVSAKSAKGAAKESKGAIEDAAPEAPAVDLEELEDEAAEATARSGGGGADAALAAAAAGTGEMSASFKNFRHHPDMENFYRFIYENDLRHEAVAIMDRMQAERLERKNVKFAKGQAH